MDEYLKDNTALLQVIFVDLEIILFCIFFLLFILIIEITATKSESLASTTANELICWHVHCHLTTIGCESYYYSVILECFHT